MVEAAVIGAVLPFLSLRKVEGGPEDWLPKVLPLESE
jgi:hypothetical protein